MKHQEITSSFGLTVAGYRFQKIEDIDLTNNRDLTCVPKVSYPNLIPGR